MTLMKFILQKTRQKNLPRFINVDFKLDIVTKALQKYVKLLLNDLKNFHGASLDTDATGDALGGSALFSHNHDLHGAGLDALAALHAQLLIDHVNAGLGVLGDSTSLTDLSTLAALNADIGLSLTILASNDLDAAQIRMELLVECIGASTDALQASHALYAFLNGKSLHRKNLFSKIFLMYYTEEKAK